MFKTVLTHLKKAFDELDRNTVQGCIQKVSRHVDDLQEHIVQQEEKDEAADIKENDKNDSDSDSEDK